MSCLTLSCVSALTACAKKDQSNTIEFSGVYQSSAGDVLLQIDNIEDYSNPYLEYTIDGGATWSQAFIDQIDSKKYALAANYSDSIKDSTLKIAVRMAETDDANASAASEFIEYKVKSPSDVKEIFYQFGDENTSDYTLGQGWGIKAYKLVLQPDKSAKIEKFDYTDDGDFGYNYTYAANNWDKNAIKFQYKFVPFYDAFETYNADLPATDLDDYENTFNTDGWNDYNIATGINAQNYTGHTEIIPSINISLKVFTVMIRAKATNTNLHSSCSPVCVILEEIEDA